MTALFRGIYEHQLDDKNRLRIPAKFKKGLTGEDDANRKTYSFTRGLNGCIYVFPDEVLDELIDELSEEKLGDSSKASLLFFSSVFPAEEDGQGRVVLPAKLKELAGIKKDIVTIGRGKRLEIWAAERYNAYIEGVDFDEEFKKTGDLTDAGIFAQARHAGGMYGRTFPQRGGHLLRRHDRRRRTFL